ncbi:alpha/beta-hydrolase [Pseudovirgaria hyperparasitica]|uniref:Alpha/beta-hydrolase n=1 Tax=Pseudovirgaria hyperparasitica TaxID=470096 RepID=A0A6A6W8L5_9PEZI|nr:alpha/beta-hydrolase [Pseudovirgaria hyperparasitica]KAF2758895.1 alpha/beta-hydrolase [Pseudovirgaria hyperparasitica]
MPPAPFPPLPLPDGITENYISCPTTGLTFHVLEAGHDALPSGPDSHSNSKTRPLILLLHGFPELAFSWRHIMPTLSSAGYYVVAPDQRGYGRTTGWDASPFHATDLSTYQLTNLVRDMVVLVHALGYTSVRCVVGHDFGGVSAAMCALMRPDLFTSVVLMSHPFKGSSVLPFDYAHSDAGPGGIEGGGAGRNIAADLASLPRPRKHYKWYNSTASAAGDWLHPRQGLQKFLRGYIHLKSADWKGNEPRPLKAWSAEEVGKMPEYYVLPLDSTMPEVVAANMTGEDEGVTKRWLSDDDLAVYVQEWSRTGFQGGLNWYRAQTNPENMRDVDLFAGKKIECPATFVSGDKDWGNYQQPGVIENLPNSCSDFRGVTFLKGAGHWPQQEQPKQVVDAILGFISKL